MRELAAVIAFVLFFFVACGTLDRTTRTIYTCRGCLENYALHQLEAAERGDYDGSGGLVVVVAAPRGEPEVS